MFYIDSSPKYGLPKIRQTSPVSLNCEIREHFSADYEKGGEYVSTPYINGVEITCPREFVRAIGLPASAIKDEPLRTGISFLNQNIPETRPFERFWKLVQDRTCDTTESFPKTRRFVPGHDREMGTEKFVIRMEDDETSAAIFPRRGNAPYSWFFE